MNAPSSSLDPAVGPAQPLSDNRSAGAGASMSGGAGGAGSAGSASAGSGGAQATPTPLDASQARDSDAGQADVDAGLLGASLDAGSTEPKRYCPDDTQRWSVLLTQCLDDSECEAGERCSADPADSTCFPDSMRPGFDIPCTSVDLCLPGYVCDPDNATLPNGCRALPCSDPDGLRCEALDCDARPWHASGKCSQTCASSPGCPGEQCALFTDRPAPGCRVLDCRDEPDVCPPNYRCRPDSLSAHGCEALACATASDCDCGSCVNGMCQPRPGVCTTGCP